MAGVFVRAAKGVEALARVASDEVVAALALLGAPEIRLL